MASICSAIFAANLPITTECTIMFEGGDINVGAARDSITFTKLFTYTIGPNPDGSSSNYGWQLITGGGWTSVITSSGIIMPTTPDITGTPNTIKNGQVSIQATLDRAAAIALSPDADVATVTYTIRMNTGTP